MHEDLYRTLDEEYRAEGVMQIVAFSGIGNERVFAKK